MDYEVDDTHAYDLALDYVENEVGCFDFLGNWKRLRSEEWINSKLENWLKSVGEKTSQAKSLFDAIDAIYLKAKQWKA